MLSILNIINLIRMVIFPMSKKKSNIEINVIGSVDRALRQLKKKIEREGVVRDMKRCVYFEPKTQKRRKRLMRAIKQNMTRMITDGTYDSDAR